MTESAPPFGFELSQWRVEVEVIRRERRRLLAVVRVQAASFGVDGGRLIHQFPAIVADEQFTKRAHL